MQYRLKYCVVVILALDSRYIQCLLLLFSCTGSETGDSSDLHDIPSFPIQKKDFNNSKVKRQAGTDLYLELYVVTDVAAVSVCVCMCVCVCVCVCVFACDVMCAVCTFTCVCMCSRILHFFYI